MAAPWKLPSEGDIVHLRREHIFNASEDLILRVREIGDGDGRPPPRGVEWVHVAGDALNPDLSFCGIRSATVRLVALYMPTEG